MNLTVVLPTPPAGTLPLTALPHLQPDPTLSDPGRWWPQLLGLLQAEVMFATLAHLPVLLRDLLPEHSQLLHARLEGLPASTASTSQHVHVPIHVVLDQASLRVLLAIICREEEIESCRSSFPRCRPSRDQLNPTRTRKGMTDV